MASTLTRDEARDRARLIDVHSYQVDLDLTRGDKTFTSVTTVAFCCSRPGADSYIDLTALAIQEIILNGEAVEPSACDGDRIALAGLQAENELRVVADCEYSRGGEGLHRFEDPADGGVYLYSDLETFDAHRIYACFDQPDLKATFELAATVPRGWEVASNMAASSEPEPVEDDSAGVMPAGEGAARWTFPPTPVMSTYITAIAAGPYHVVRSEHDGIPLEIFCRQSLAPYLNPDEIFEVT
ncbi:MAG TPA: aminopeptidase N, partial [Streptosporangiaceae bacterium]